MSHVRRKPQLLYELPPRKFEEFVGELLQKLGYEVTLTKASRDGGKDLYAMRHSSLGTHLYLVECKRYAPNRPVGVDVVRGLHGVVEQEGATMGVVATTSRFTREAEEFTNVIKYKMSLRDFNGLTRWMEEYFAL